MKMTVAALPVPSFVLFPGCTVTLQIGLPALHRQLEYAKKRGGLICVTQADAQWRPFKTGCLAEVRSIKPNAQGRAVTLAGIRRMEVQAEVRSEKMVFWTGEAKASQPWAGEEPPCLTSLPEFVQSCQPRFPAETWLDIAAFHAPGLPLAQKQRLLDETDPHKRYYHMMERSQPAPAATQLSWN